MKSYGRIGCIMPAAMPIQKERGSGLRNPDFLNGGKARYDEIRCVLKLTKVFITYISKMYCLTLGNIPCESTKIQFEL